MPKIEKEILSRLIKMGKWESGTGFRPDEDGYQPMGDVQRTYYFDPVSRNVYNEYEKEEEIFSISGDSAKIVHENRRRDLGLIL